jgi:MFS family permease
MPRVRPSGVSVNGSPGSGGVGGDGDDTCTSRTATEPFPDQPAASTAAAPEGSPSSASLAGPPASKQSEGWRRWQLSQAFLASPNVPRTFFFNFVDGACFSLWQNTLFQKFVYDLGGNSNSAVGYTSGALGAAQVVCAIIGSYIADKKSNRQAIFRMATFAGAAGVATTILAVIYKNMALFYICSVFWGMYNGLNNPTTEALFGDSVTSANRATVYTAKWMVQISSYLVGSVASIVLFLHVGDHWNYGEMGTVMEAGLGAHCLAFLLLWTILDRHRLGGGDAASSRVSDTDDEDAGSDSGSAHGLLDANNERTPQRSRKGGDGYGSVDVYERRRSSGTSGGYVTRTTNTVSTSDDGTDHIRSDQLLHEDGVVGGVPTHSPISGASDVPYHRRKKFTTSSGSPVRVVHRREAASPSSDDEQQRQAQEALQSTYFNDTENERNGKRLLFTRRGIPYWVVTADVLAAVGAGMTLRFLPLFFIEMYSISPIDMTILMGVVTISVTIFALVVKVVSAKVFKNRVATSMLFRFIGAMATFYLGFAWGEGEKFYPMAVVLVLRMGCMNSIYGLTRSVIMDHVPSEQRARWSALESLSGFSWAGSAVIGGVIADRHGYRATFVVTGIIHTVASFIPLPAACMLQDAVFAAPAAGSAGNVPPVVTADPAAVSAAPAQASHSTSRLVSHHTLDSAGHVTSDSRIASSFAAAMFLRSDAVARGDSFALAGACVC